ncbi:adenylate/guanylate cyclase domain-containing protein [bacterium]|nr:adenylate/guanylate cyclase domain-containing protein [bacterium]
MVGEVQFTTMADGREIAYRVMSQAQGPTILYTHHSTFPVEVLDEEPMYDLFFRTLGQCGRLVLFDKPGVGASDPFDRDRDYIDQTIDAYLAVLNALDVHGAWLVGHQTLETARLAASHRSRLVGAVLLNPLSPATASRWDPASITDREHDNREEVNPERADDPAHWEWLQRARRLGASAAGSRDFVEALTTSTRRAHTTLGPIDDAPPVLLIHRRDAADISDQQWWNRIFPDAESVTIEGTARPIAARDAGLVAELMVEFITGERATASSERTMVAVLFTDLVDSTPTAAASGDTIWRSTLDRYEASLRRMIERHHGTVIKTTGDGALATFPSGSEAVAAATALRNAANDLGLEGRTGIHVGEVEQRGDDIGGIAVNLTARVMGQAQPGEVVVTSSLEQATVGTRFQFDDLGIRPLKGIDRPWQLFAVRQQH